MAATVTAGAEQIMIAVDNPDRPDFGGIYVWKSTSSGFTPGPGNLAYKGPDLRVLLTGLPADVTQYIKIAIFSLIDENDYIVSSEYSATPTAPAVAAEDIVAGIIRGSHFVGGAYMSQGTVLAAPYLGGTTLTVHDTTDFSSSGGTAVVFDTGLGASRNYFSYTGKTDTTLTGCTSLSPHSTVIPGVHEPLVVPLAQGVIIDPLTQELVFYSKVSSVSSVYEECFTVGNNTSSYSDDPVLVTMGTSGSGKLVLALQAKSGQRVMLAQRSSNAGHKWPIMHLYQGSTPSTLEPSIGPSVVLVENTVDDASGYLFYGKARGANGAGMKLEAAGTGVGLNVSASSGGVAVVGSGGVGVRAITSSILGLHVDTSGGAVPIYIAPTATPTVPNYIGSGALYYDSASKQLSSHDGSAWGRYVREGSANAFALVLGGNTNVVGSLRVGDTTAPAPNVAARISKNMTGSSTAYGVLTEGSLQSDVSAGRYFCTIANVAAGFTGTVDHFLATKGTFTGTPDTQAAFHCANDITGATTANYCLWDTRSAGATNWGVYISNAKSYFGGQVLQTLATGSLSSGGTATFGTGDRYYLQRSTSTLSSLTVRLPSAADDAQCHKFMSRGAITALTVTALDSALVRGQPTSLPAEGFFEMMWSQTHGAWVRSG